MNFKAVILFFSLNIICFTLSAQTLNTSKLDSLFNALEENNKAMGSLAIAENGKIIYTNAIGNASIGSANTIEATPLTKYRIGSVTKTFTAVMIFMAAEEGKLKLADKLSGWYPEVPNSDKITIEQMLSHHSGIYSITSDPTYNSWKSSGKSKREIVEMISKGTPRFDPDTKSEYSNSNFILLGFILEEIYSKHYSDILKDKIIDKIGLKDTYYGRPTDLKNNESYSYHLSGNTWVQETETDMSIPHGAGAIVSTPSDLAIFFTSLFHGKLLKAENIDKMKSIRNGYGLGLLRNNFGAQIAFGHNGSIDDFRTVASYFPDSKMAIAYTSNGQNYNVNSILLGVLNIYNNLPYQIPSFKSFSVSSEILDSYLGIYSSSDMPLKITISKNENVLMAQATGQGAFPLEAKSKNIFEFEPAQVAMEFNPDQKTMVLKQAGRIYNFKLE